MKAPLLHVAIAAAMSALASARQTNARPAGSCHAHSTCHLDTSVFVVSQAYCRHDSASVWMLANNDPFWKSSCTFKVSSWSPSDASTAWWIHRILEHSPFWSCLFTKTMHVIQIQIKYVMYIYIYIDRYCSVYCKCLLQTPQSLEASHFRSAVGSCPSVWATVAPVLGLSEHLFLATQVLLSWWQPN